MANAVGNLAGNAVGNLVGNAAGYSVGQGGGEKKLFKRGSDWWKFSIWNRVSGS